MSDPRHEVPQTIQALPSVGAILLWLSGKDVNWWAAALGVVFILLQIVYMLWKWRRDIRRDRRDEADHTAKTSRPVYEDE